MDLRCTLKLCDTVVFDEIKPFVTKSCEFLPNTYEWITWNCVDTENIFDVMMNLCYCLNYGLYGLSM